MTKPTIHMNGTHPKDLLESIEKAYQAIGMAVSDMRDVAPNGRDYYPQGPDVYYAARNEHDARVQKLIDVQKELESLMENVCDDPYSQGKL